MGNSDFQCSPINPLLGLKSAVARQTRAGFTLAPSEAIDVAEAMRMFTTEAACAGFDERTSGSLDLGKLADVIVLSEDPYTAPPATLDSIEVDVTIVGGEVVFQRQAA